MSKMSLSLRLDAQCYRRGRYRSDANHKPQNTKTCVCAPGISMLV